MRRATLLLLALAAALSGCAAPSFAGPSDGACYDGGAAAEWTEPGLHAALPAAAAAAGIPPMVLLQGNDEEPLAAGEFDHGLWQEERLAMLEYRDPGSGMVVRMVRVAASEHDVWVMGSGHDERALPPFRALLEGVGLGDAPELPAWERGLLATARQGAHLTVRILGEPDVHALHARVAQGNATVERSPSSGEGVLAWGEWAFHFRLGRLRYSVPVEGSAPLQLWVAENDRVLATGEVDRTATPWPDLQERVEEAFAKLGLPPPTYADLGRRPPACGV